MDVEGDNTRVVQVHPCPGILFVFREPGIAVWQDCMQDAPFLQMTYN